MKGRIFMFFEQLKDAVHWRQSLHRCPQPAWLEFYATAFVAEKLASWGYKLSLGRDIIKEGEQLLLPAPEILSAEFDRAAAAGAKLEFLEPARGGFTGVVATLHIMDPGNKTRN